MITSNTAATANPLTKHIPIRIAVTEPAGPVYLCYDATLGRRVALKVMLPHYAVQLDAHDRFLR